MSAINITRRAVAVTPPVEDDPWAAIGEQSLVGIDADALRKSADVTRVLQATTPPRTKPIGERSRRSKVGDLPDLAGEGLGFRREPAARPHQPLLGTTAAPDRSMLIRTAMALGCFGAAMAIGSWLRSEQHNPVQGAIVVAFGAVVAFAVWLSGR